MAAACSEKSAASRRATNTPLRSVLRASAAGYRSGKPAARAHPRPTPADPMLFSCLNFRRKGRLAQRSPFVQFVRTPFHDLVPRFQRARDLHQVTLGGSPFHVNPLRFPVTIAN